MKFTKMQAMGNCYIYVEQFTQTVENPAHWAKILSNRETGVGSDGLILIAPSGCADVRMRVFNPDGTEAEMCGNALRSTGMLVYETGVVNKTELTVETLAGIRRVWLDTDDGHVRNITASVGAPVMEPSLIPMDTALTDRLDRFVDVPVTVRDREFLVTALSWGNPHAVCWLSSAEDIIKFPLHLYGSELERHKLFPRRANIEFAQVIDRKTLYMRTWERRTGETYACATGCCTALVSGVLTNRCENSIEVKQLGGSIHAKWDTILNDVTMTGPSKIVFRGEVEDDYDPEFSTC